MFLLNWLWQIEICKLDFAWRYLCIPEVMAFEFHTPVFKKVSIDWPQQPPIETVPYISESLDFWWTIPQKMSNTGHFDAINDQTIGIRNFFWRNKALEAVEANEVAEVAEVNEAAVVSKAWKIIIEDFRVVLVLEFNILRTKIFQFRVLKKKFFWQNHENSCWIFCWRLLRPAYVTFLKTGGWNSNAITSGIHRYPQTKSNLHISIC